MIGIFVKRYIKHNLNKSNQLVPDDIEAILINAINLDFCKNQNIKYSYFFPDKNTIDACISMTKCIRISAMWALHIVKNGHDECVMNAFHFSLGHEIAHINDYDFYALDFLNRSVISWINEVHADFKACQLVAHGKREKLVQAIEYKKILKSNDKDCKYHPSWERRLIYAQQENFNNELIEKIAADAGCTNQRLIKKISNYYDDIILI